MTIKSLNEFPERLKERYLRFAEVMRQAARDYEKEKFIRYAGYQSQILEDLRAYRDTALWRYQRQACQKIIDELEKIY